MNTICKRFAMILSLALICGLSLSAAPQKSKKKAPGKAAKTAKAMPVDDNFLAKGDGIEFCAVSGEKLENKNLSAKFFGREVYFCCKDCLATAQANPSKYIKKTEAEQVAAIKALTSKAEGMHEHHAAKESATAFLGKGDGIETCPVTGEAISKEVSFQIQGKTVYACCASCIEVVKKNPELYLKWAAKN
jgi:YHS domain-containing protein